MEKGGRECLHSVPAMSGPTSSLLSLCWQWWQACFSDPLRQRSPGTRSSLRHDPTLIESDGCTLAKPWKRDCRNNKVSGKRSVWLERTRAVATRLLRKQYGAGGSSQLRVAGNRGDRMVGLQSSSIARQLGRLFLLTDHQGLDIGASDLGSSIS